MKKIYPLQVGILLLLALSVTVKSSAQKKTIGIIGSSTAACKNVGLDSCWTTLVNVHYYGDLQMTNNMVNVAWPGWNVYQSMPNAYVPPPNRPLPDPIGNFNRLVDMNADIIIVNLPSNGYSEWTKTEVMHCFRILRDSANNRGKKFFITTTQPRHNYPDFDTQVKRDSLMALRDSILTVFGANAIDFWTGLANPDGSIREEYDQGDHIHLNGLGHRILYERILQKDVLAESAALPIFNLGFQSSFKEGKVLLNWKNDPASQIELFQLQKSRDGKNFTTIYEVKTISSNSYSFVDEKPEEGNNYYRLQVYFKSGKKDFSQVLKQSIRNGSFKLDKVYKSAQGLQIEWQSRIRQNYSFKLYNTLGSVVGSSQYGANAGNNRISMPLNGNIAAGSYFLVMENTLGEKEVWPLMIQN